jgi:hypothetical protein
MTPPLSARKFFEQLNKDTTYLVDDFYDERVRFVDPVTLVDSRPALKDYYTRLYRNVISIRFDFSEEIVRENTLILVWTMHLVSKLNSGQPMRVQGISHIKFGGREGKAVYHRDYYDMGEFVYERIPVLSSLIRFIKGQFSGH